VRHVGAVGDGAWANDILNMAVLAACKVKKGTADAIPSHTEVDAFLA
jgi:hypothetical protein